MGVVRAFEPRYLRRVEDHSQLAFLEAPIGVIGPEIPVAKLVAPRVSGIVTEWLIGSVALTVPASTQP